jgi:flavin reductase (DIM6/NTAB) family NADH-FMN oxidoreductase RutF
MHFEKVSWKELGPLAWQTIEEVGGLLLVTQGKRNSTPNVMTIGWALFGIVWRRPEIAVFVRPSRFTHALLEEQPVFTVNIPSLSLSRAVEECGKRSGRDTDKFALCGLTPVYLDGFPVPSITECIASIQCVVVEKSHVESGSLLSSIREMYYPQGDYHTIYFGEAQAAWKHTK